MVTLREIARRAGTSYTTVAYALNPQPGKGTISNETRRRILKIADEMGYRRNELARAVVTGKYPVLGFLAQDGKSIAEFRSLILSGAVEEATRQGYLIKSVNFQHATLLEAVERCIAWRLAGVITGGLGIHALVGVCEALSAHSIPLATVEEAPPYPPGQHFASDHRLGIAQGVNHLIALGHRRIAYIASTSLDQASNYRIRLFREAMQVCQQDVPNEYIVHGDWQDIELNKAAFTQLWATTNPHPTAIFCCGDPVALTVIRLARAVGLNVPEDLSVVGYGDYTMAQYADPPLTTIAQPFDGLGLAAARHLIESIRRSDASSSVSTGAETQESFLATRLIVRDSTAPPLA
jgi:LacI family transcriptional regulator